MYYSLYKQPGITQEGAPGENQRCLVESNRTRTFHMNWGETCLLQESVTALLNTLID
jgi:hypothetical protein